MKKVTFNFRSSLKFLLTVTIIGIYWYWINQKIISDSNQVFGLTGFFLLICGSTAFFPLPANLVVLGAVKIYAPLLVAIIGAMGTLVAYFSEYIVFTFLFKLNRVAKFKNTWLYKKADSLFKNYQFFTLTFASFLPLPTEPLRIYVITQKYPKIRYMLSGFIGRFSRYFLLGYYGREYVNSVWFLSGVLLFPVFFLILIRISVSLFDLVKVKYFTKPADAPISLSIPFFNSSTNFQKPDLEQSLE